MSATSSFSREDTVAAQSDDVMSGTESVMSEAEYSFAREGLRERYGADRKQTISKRDQALAYLAFTSGLDPNKIARLDDIHYKVAVHRILFGRFLRFTASDNQPNLLTASKFRAYWARTTKTLNDYERFNEIRSLVRMESDERRNPSKVLGNRIKGAFADGKWHKIDEIIERLREFLPEHIEIALTLMVQNGAYQTKCETKKVGTHLHYRIFRNDRSVGSHELNEKLGPLVDGFLKATKFNLANVKYMSPDVCDNALKIDRLVSSLGTLLSEWTK